MTRPPCGIERERFDGAAVFDDSGEHVLISTWSNPTICHGVSVATEWFNFFFWGGGGIIASCVRRWPVFAWAEKPQQRNPSRRAIGILRDEKERLRIRAMLLKLDGIIAHSALAFGGSEGVLLTFLFHGLFEELSRRDAAQRPDRARAGNYRQRCSGVSSKYFQQHGYTFVSPTEISHGLDSGGKYVLVTFDDGYFSNTKALPILERYGIPAALFVSTDHVIPGQGVLVGTWWRENRCGST